MSYCGNFATGAVIYDGFNTYGSTGAPITLAGSPTIACYRDDDTTQTTAGLTLSVDFDGVTGSHVVKANTAADAAFYAGGRDFRVQITAGTADGVSMVGTVVMRFKLEHGYADANVVKALGVAIRNEDFTINSATSTTVTLPTTDSGGVTIPDDDRYEFTVLDVVQGTGRGQKVHLTTATGTPRVYNVEAGTMPEQLDGTSKVNVLTTTRTNVTRWQSGVPAALVGGRVDASLGNYQAGMAGACWDELRSAHTTAGTFGQGAASVQGDVTGRVLGNSATAFSGVGVQANTTQLAGQAVTAGAGVTFPSSVMPAGNVTVGTFATGAITRSAFSADSGLQTFLSATAQAGSSNTITLNTGAHASNDYYQHTRIELTGGTGAGQARNITGYNGTSKVAVVDANWAVIPDATTTFAIKGADAIAGSGLTATAIATAVWQDATAGDFVVAGSPGKRLFDNLDVTVSSRLAPTVAGRTLAVGTAGHAGLDWANISGQGTSQSLSGTTISTAQFIAQVTGSVGSVGGNVGGNVIGSVGSVASNGITQASFAADTGLRPIRSATCQGGSSTSIVLDAGASSVTDYYKNDLVYLTGGTGAGQARYCTAYNGTTKVATVAAWATNPDSSTTFSVLPGDAIPGATAPTAAQVATAVWQDTTAGDFVVVGSPGKRLLDNLDATVTSRLAPTVAGRTLDVSATGEAGLDWANVGGATTTVNLSGTTIATSQVVASVTGNVGGNVAGSVASVTGNVGGSVGSVGAGGITNASLAADTGRKPLRTGTAQGGSSTTIVLDAGAASQNGFYTNTLVKLVSGTGAGQSRYITAYDGTTKVATVAAWTVNPDTSTVFAVLEGDAIPGATAPTAAQVATEVWTTTTAGNFNVVGSMGKRLTDNVDVTVGSRLAPTVAGRTLDVTATGAAGLDWGNVENPTTAVGLTGTTISTSQAVASVTGAVGSVTGAVGSVTGNVGGSVASVAAGGITGASFATDTAIKPLRQATAQGGSATTITLDAGAAAQNDFYKNTIVKLISGTGAGQSRYITAYNGTTKAATVTAWVVNPDTSTVFAIFEGDAIPGATAPTVSQIVAGVYGELDNTANFTGVGTIGKRFKDNLDVAVGTRLAPTTAGRTLDVSATGEAGVDWSNVGGQAAAVNLSATTVGNLADKTGVTLAAAGLDPVLVESGIAPSANLVNDSGAQQAAINVRQALALMVSDLVGVLAGANTTTVTTKPAGKPAAANRLSVGVDATGRLTVTMRVPD